MKRRACCCCAARRDAGSASVRVRTLLSGVAPGLILALTPKCPACVAAYVALLTGISLSPVAASALRTGWIALSILALAMLAILTLRAARR